MRQQMVSRERNPVRPCNVPTEAFVGLSRNPTPNKVALERCNHLKGLIFASPQDAAEGGVRRSSLGTPQSLPSLSIRGTRFNPLSQFIRAIPRAASTQCDWHRTEASARC